MQVRGGSGTLDHLLVENCSHQACAIWGELMGLCVSDRPPDFRDVHVRRAMLELSKNTTGNGTPIMTKDPPEGPNSSARFTHAGGLHDLAGHGCRTAVESRRRVVLDGWRDRARSAPLTAPRTSGRTFLRPRVGMDARSSTSRHWTKTLPRSQGLTHQLAECRERRHRDGDDAGGTHADVDDSVVCLGHGGRSSTRWSASVLAGVSAPSRVINLTNDRCNHPLEMERELRSGPATRTESCPEV